LSLSFLHRGLAPLASVVFFALGGCTPSTEVVDDAVACGGVQCTAGSCFSTAGQPGCRCGPWEESAGLVCQVAVFVEPDDHGGSPEAATVLTVEQGPVEGRISASTRGMSDRDLFTFTAKAGHLYVFVCEPLTLSRCQTRLLDATGRHVGTPTVDERQTAWAFIGLGEGRWYVEVSGEVGGTGTYSFQLLDLGLDDHGDSLVQASEVSPSDATFPVTSSSLADQDVIRFQAVAGHGYRFGCELPKLESGVMLQLLDGEGRVLETVEGLGTRRRPQLDFNATTSGPWYVQVSPSAGQMPLMFNCWLKDLGLDDHGDTRATATWLTPGVPVPVCMHSNKDVDELAFTAERGHHYMLRKQPSLPVDIQLSHASGRRMGTNAPNGYLPLQGMAGGIHLKLQPPRHGYSDKPFQLVVEDLGVDDHPEDVSEATPSPLSVPIPVRTHFPLDMDSLDFRVEADGVYVVMCEPECLAQIFVQGSWTNAAPTLVSSKHVNANGSPYLHVTVHPIALPGAHTVKVARVGTDDYPALLTKATDLQLPASVSGVFEAENDQEVFFVTLEAGRTYKVKDSPAKHSSSVRVSFQESPGHWVTPARGRYMPRVSGRYAMSLQLVEGGEPGPWSLKLTSE